MVSAGQENSPGRIGGLPPFLGFLPKWIVIQSVVINNQLFLISILIVITLITLFFYLRLCYSAFILNYFELNTNYFIIYKKNIIFTYIILNLFIPISIGKKVY